MLAWILTIAVAVAAPNPKSAKPLPRHVDLKQTLSAVTLPTPTALKLISAQGSAGYKNLITLAFAPTQSIDVQWKALALLSILGGKHSLPQLERAASSDQWYHRNAALLGFSKVSREKAIQWGRKLLLDPSLIVRTSAVQTLKAFKDTSSSKDLWTQLYDKRNFKSGRSLWIRRHIVEALVEIAGRGDEAKLVGVLRDNDESLHKPAINALERITKNHLGKPEEPTAYKKQYWEKWWQAQAGTPSKAL